MILEFVLNFLGFIEKDTQYLTHNLLLHLTEKVVDLELLLASTCFYFKDLMDNFGVFSMALGILKLRLL